jgi:hypothetical protein
MQFKSLVGGPAVTGSPSGAIRVGARAMKAVKVGSRAGGRSVPQRVTG